MYQIRGYNKNMANIKKQRAPSSLTTPQYKKRNVEPIMINPDSNELDDNQFQYNTLKHAEIDNYEDVDTANYIPPSRNKVRQNQDTEQEASLDDIYWLFLVTSNGQKLLSTCNDEDEVKSNIVELVGSQNIDISNLRLFKKVNLEIGVILG
jgi:hypothetical protein